METVLEVVEEETKTMKMEEDTVIQEEETKTMLEVVEEHLEEGSLA